LHSPLILFFLLENVNFTLVSQKNMSKKKTEDKNWETKQIDIEEVESEEDEPTQILPQSKEKKWMKKEGELAVDVFETEQDIIIQAPVAGVKKSDLEIVTEKDVVVIKGSRERPSTNDVKGFYTQECFFGKFKREVILPEETDPSRIDANIKEGILTIKVPKIERDKRRKIDI